MSSAHPSIRKLVYRFTGAVTGTPTSIHTLTGVPEKGHIAGLYITAAAGSVTPLLSADSAAAATHINKILEFDGAMSEPAIPRQPIYYEAHDDSGVFKIYLKPVTSEVSTNVNYRIDIWPAA